MHRLISVMITTLALTLIFSISTMAGTEPSPFQPTLTMENSTNDLGAESPFYSVPFEDVNIEIFYMGADGSMILWGNYFIESIGSGNKFVADSDDFNPSIPFNEVPPDAKFFTKGLGSAQRCEMMVFSENTTEVSGIPSVAPYVELLGYDPTGSIPNILPTFAFKPTDLIDIPVPGVKVGLVEISFKNVSSELPTKVEYPSPEAPTLQDAIDLVADGGTVDIKAGVFEITQPVFIMEKTIRIKGAGSSQRNNPKKVTQLLAAIPTEVVSADSAIGVINFVGGGGVIKKLDITGGDACVVARDTDVISDAVKIKNVVLSNAGRGILWQSEAQLAVKNTIIEDCQWNAISVAPKNDGMYPSEYRGNLIIEHSVIINPSMVGLYFSNAIGFVNDVTIYNSQAIAAYQSKVQVTNSRLYNSKISAITFWDSNYFNPPGAPSNLIQDNLIVNVDPDNNDAFGDGIGLFASNTELIDNEILSPFRSGVANYGSSAIARDNYIFCANIDLIGEDWLTVDFNFDDQGGNLCGCTNDPFHACTIVSSSVEPPPPIGGLE